MRLLLVADQYYPPTLGGSAVTFRRLAHGLRRRGHAVTVLAPSVSLGRGGVEDEDGVTVVTGYAARRRIPWADVERVGLGVHRSLGRRTEILEIDTGEALHLFSRHDLGVPCAEAARDLAALRRPAGDEGDDRP